MSSKKDQSQDQEQEHKAARMAECKAMFKQQLMEPILCFLQLRTQSAGEVVKFMSTLHSFANPPGSMQAVKNVNMFLRDTGIIPNERAEFIYSAVHELVIEHLNEVKKRLLPNGEETVEDALLPNVFRNYCKEWDDFFPTRKSTVVFDQISTAVMGTSNGSSQGVKWGREFLAMYIDEWYKLVYIPLQNTLTRSVVYLIESDRQGNSLGAGTIKSYRESLTLMDNNKEVDAVKLFAPPTQTVETQRKTRGATVQQAQGHKVANTQPINTKQLEQKYLAEPIEKSTVAYCEAQAASILASQGHLEFVDRLSDLVVKERTRIIKFLGQVEIDSKTQDVISVIDRLLISNQVPRIAEGFLTFIAQGNVVAIQKQINLISRTGRAEDIQNLADKLRDIVKQDGETKMKALPASAFAEDCATYVRTLAGVHARYSELIKGLGQPAFEQAVHTALKDVVNIQLTPPEKEDGEGAGRKVKEGCRTAEVLARYIDACLKKGNKSIATDDDMKNAINDCMTVFLYLNDKEPFKGWYQRNLARRLLNNVFISDAREDEVLGHLKRQEGGEFVRHMEVMVADYRGSQSLNTRFTQLEGSSLPEVAGGKPVSFDVTLLTANAWPYNAATRVFVPAPLMQACMTKFTSFYSTEQQNRKLTWLHEHSKADITCMMPSNKYEASMTVHQATLLLMFNLKAEVSLSEMVDSTKLKIEEIKRALDPMLSIKLLMVADGSAYDAKKLNETSTLKVNESFSNPRIKLNLARSMQQETRAEAQKVHGDLRREKDFWLDAAIVRIMKSRKTCTFNDLLQEVFKQAQGRYSVTKDEIKSRVDGLMDKDYMKRDDNDMSLFVYVA